MTQELDAMPSAASDPWALLKEARAEIERLEVEAERARAFAQWVADNSNDPHVVARARFWSRPALEPKP